MQNGHTHHLQWQNPHLPQLCLALRRLFQCHRLTSLEHPLRHRQRRLAPRYPSRGTILERTVVVAFCEIGIGIYAWVCETDGVLMDNVGVFDAIVDIIDFAIILNWLIVVSTR